MSKGAGGAGGLGGGQPAHTGKSHGRHHRTTGTETDQSEPMRRTRGADPAGSRADQKQATEAAAPNDEKDKATTAPERARREERGRAERNEVGKAEPADRETRPAEGNIALPPSE